MKLAYITHDIANNTLEAVWTIPIYNDAGEVAFYQRVKNRNYSPDQKEEFLADCGPDAQKYVDMAGW